MAPFGPQMTQFWPFSPKTTYVDQIDAINDIFDQIHTHKLYWKTFPEILENFFYQFPQFDIWRHFDPKMTQFLPFSPKKTYFD